MILVSAEVGLPKLYFESHLELLKGHLGEMDFVDPPKIILLVFIY